MSSEVDPKGLEAAAQKMARMEVYASPGALDNDLLRIERLAPRLKPEAKVIIQAYLSASPSIGRVGVKALEWHGPDYEDEYWAASIAEKYVIRPPTGNGRWLSVVGGYFPTVEAAQAAAEAHNQSRILSALVYHEEPAGDTQGAGEDDAEPTWRDLALQFDGQRIEALSLLRYVSEARNCAEATGRAAEIRPFLAKAPLSGEAVLAARLAALVSPPDNGEPVAWADVIAERRRQVEVEGWTPAHDDKHDRGEMAYAAACYALASRLGFSMQWLRDIVDRLWPWDRSWWKPTNPRRNLVKAAALLLADIERIDRAALQSHNEGRDGK